MKIRTQDLSGPALDWAVAKCEPDTLDLYYANDEPLYLEEAPDYHQEWNPSTNWFQGGLLIERERLLLAPGPNKSDENLRWHCVQHDIPVQCYADGPTPLIAAMRCYVFSKLGEEVDVPETLITGGNHV